MAAEPLEVRMARLEGAYEQIDRRLGSIEERMTRLETRIDAIAAELRSELRRQFYWTLAFLAPLYALLVGLILQLRR